jgi:YYY domain-containing protein
VLYRPFWRAYGSFYNSLEPWQGTRTVLWAFLVVHGLFLFAIVSYLLVRTFGRSGSRRPDPLVRRAGLTLRHRRAPDRLRRAACLVRLRGLPVSRWLWAGLALLLVVEIVLLVPGLLPITRPKADVEPGSFAYRGLAVFALGLPVALLGMLLLFRPRIRPVERLWCFLVLLGLGMSLGVEVVVLQGDIGRMNTVFKFYLQVWCLWAVAAAAALARIVAYVRRWRWGRGAWLAVLALLIFCAALYPPLAAVAKVRDRFNSQPGPGGLDGWAYMQTALYFDNGQEYPLKWDYQAIQWMLDNIVGSPTILEAYAPEYRWGARYAINTGLPTVLGWNWHERQQRAAAGDQEVWTRATDVGNIYGTLTLEQAWEKLEQYGVRYVIVGPLERANYSPGGLMKFEWMVNDGLLSEVYHNEGVTIYEVSR